MIQTIDMRKDVQLIIVGNGKMAGLLKEACEKENIFFNGCPETWGSGPGVVAVHFGSGRELPKLVEHCGKYGGIPILQGSTGQTLPANPPVPFVHAPNLALPIVALLGVLPQIGAALEHFGLEKSVCESHQASKKTVPETAKLMAQAVGVDPREIRSVRDPGVQKRIGVPYSSLDGHGYHWIQWCNPNLEIEISAKIRGRGSYIDGTILVARAMRLREHDLEKKVYTLGAFLAMPLAARA